MVIQLLCHCSDGGEESDDSNRPLKRSRLSGHLVNPQQRGETQEQSLQSERDSGRIPPDGISLRPLDTPSHTTLPPPPPQDPLYQEPVPLQDCHTQQVPLPPCQQLLPIQDHHAQQVPPPPCPVPHLIQDRHIQ